MRNLKQIISPKFTINEVIATQQMMAPTSIIFYLDFSYSDEKQVEKSKSYKPCIYDELRNILNECD